MQRQLIQPINWLASNLMITGGSLPISSLVPTLQSGQGTAPGPCQTGSLVLVLPYAKPAPMATLAPTIRFPTHSSNEPAHWARDLSLVEFVINNSPSQFTGCMPFFLTYGYHPATPMDLIHDSQSMVTEGVNVLMQRMERTFGRASQML